MDLVEKYKGTMEQMTEKLKAKTSRQKYADNDDYQQFKAYAWDAALWRNEGLPGIKDLIPRGASKLTECASTRMPDEC